MRHFLPVLLCLFLLGAGLPAAAQEPGAEPYASMSVDQDTFDYGEAHQGDTVRHTFVIKNTGTAVLEILHSKGSCICTVPFPPEDPIAPGETAEFVVEFRTDEQKVGPQDRNVVVVTNGNPKVVKLHLTGEVIEPRGDETNPGTNDNLFNIKKEGEINTFGSGWDQ